MGDCKILVRQIRFCKCGETIYTSILLQFAVTFVHARYAFDRARGFGWGKVALFQLCKGEIKAGTEELGGDNLSYLLALHSKREGHFLPSQP